MPIDADWLRATYVDAGRTAASIADELGCSKTTILDALRRFGVPRRPGGPARLAQLHDPDWLRDRYVDQEQSLYDIAAELGTRASTVSSALKRFAIPARRGGTPPAHGHCSGGISPTYRSWRSMLGRCTLPGGRSWEHYGARGITVCDRWRLFENFLADMGERLEGHTLDRIDPDGHYEPGNCRWATAREQERNKRLHMSAAERDAMIERAAGALEPLVPFGPHKCRDLACVALKAAGCIPMVVS